MKKAINASEGRDAPEVIIGTITICIDPDKNKQPGSSGEQNATPTGIAHQYAERNTE